MRKALKRDLGRQKQAKNLADSIASGLMAQKQDQKGRAKKTDTSKNDKQKKSSKHQEILSDWDQLDALEQDQFKKENA